MRRVGWLGLVSALALAAGPPASAQGRPDPGDVQCLSYGFMMVGARDQQVQSAGLMLSLYYLGKIDSKNPSADLEQQLYDQIKGMSTPEAAEPVAKRCGAELAARGKSLTELGQHIEKREEAAAPPPAPASK